jgi:hypothetical protein
MSTIFLPVYAIFQLSFYRFTLKVFDKFFEPTLTHVESAGPDMSTTEYTGTTVRKSI